MNLSDILCRQFLNYKFKTEILTEFPLRKVTTTHFLLQA